MFGASSTLNARKGLQRYQLGDVLAGVEAEVFVAQKRWDLAKGVAFEKDRDRAQYQVQMFGVRDQGQKDEQRQRVSPPQRPTSIPAGNERQQVGDHQQKDEKSDHT